MCATSLSLTNRSLAYAYKASKKVVGLIYEKHLVVTGGVAYRLPDRDKPKVEETSGTPISQ